MDSQSDFSSIAEDISLFIGSDTISFDNDINVTTRLIDQIEVDNFLYDNLTELTLDLDE